MSVTIISLLNWNKLQNVTHLCRIIVNVLYHTSIHVLHQEIHSFSDHVLSFGFG
uniref:Uncharacterized protein n=1 Tax=Arundo donax TaxID=35708 RepID=A0A0A9B2Y7_ARUDO